MLDIESMREGRTERQANSKMCPQLFKVGGIIIEFGPVVQEMLINVFHPLGQANILFSRV